MSVVTQVGKGLNVGLRPLGLQLVRGYSDEGGIRSFLPARRTLAAARKEGLSVSDYVDQHNAEPGATASAVEAMLKLAGLQAPVARVCEIGPGTGRYAERVIRALQPAEYEIYETAHDWLRQLRGLTNAKIMPADGRTLGGTASGSVDLVHANKVFVYLPLVTTLSYLEEMARVVRPGGAVAFDVVTEDCLDEDAARVWLTANATLYMMTGRQWAIDLLGRRGLTLTGSSFVPLAGARSELLVFRRE